MSSIGSELRSFIVQNFLFGRSDVRLDDGDSLMEKGIIDSTGVLELIAHIEETHGFKVEDRELIPENLDSIANLVAFIARKKAAA